MASPPILQKDLAMWLLLAFIAVPMLEIALFIVAFRPVERLAGSRCVLMPKVTVTHRGDRLFEA